MYVISDTCDWLLSAGIIVMDVMETSCIPLLQGAVQILGIIQEILPEVAQLNTLSPRYIPAPEVCSENGTTSQHYAIIESDHPYKPASVSNYKVSPGLIHTDVWYITLI